MAFELPAAEAVSIAKAFVREYYSAVLGDSAKLADLYSALSTSTVGEGLTVAGSAVGQEAFKDAAALLGSGSIRCGMVLDVQLITKQGDILVSESGEVQTVSNGDFRPYTHTFVLSPAVAAAGQTPASWFVRNDMLRIHGELKPVVVESPVVEVAAPPAPVAEPVAVVEEAAAPVVEAAPAPEPEPEAAPAVVEEVAAAPVAAPEPAAAEPVPAPAAAVVPSAGKPSPAAAVERRQPSGRAAPPGSAAKPRRVSPGIEKKVEEKKEEAVAAPAEPPAPPKRRDWAGIVGASVPASSGAGAAPSITPKPAPLRVVKPAAVAAAAPKPAAEAAPASSSRAPSVPAFTLYVALPDPAVGPQEAVLRAALEKYGKIERWSFRPKNRSVHVDYSTAEERDAAAAVGSIEVAGARIRLEKSIAPTGSKSKAMAAGGPRPAREGEAPRASPRSS